MAESLQVYRRSELQAVDEGCLHRLKTIWVDGVDDTSDLAIVGIGLHKVKFRYILGLVDAKLVADSELAQQAFTEGIAAAHTPSRLIPEMRQVWDWHSERFELPLEQFVTAEEKQTSGRVVFTPDLITANPSINELEIHDDKYGWSPPMTEEELRVLFQARVYTRFAQERWPGFSRYRFTLHAIRFNKTVSVVFTETDMDEIEREVEAHIATIEEAKRTNHWPAVAGPACRYCELQCPLMDQAMVVPKRILDRSQAEQLGGWLLAAGAVMKSAKKTLKAYAAAHGPINVNGVVWDNRASIQKLYPIDVVLEVLKMRGIHGAFEDAKQQGLTISRSALSKLFKAYPKLEEDLTNYTQEKTSYRFSAKQAGEEDGEDE